MNGRHGSLVLMSKRPYDDLRQRSRAVLFPSGACLARRAAGATPRASLDLSGFQLVGTIVQSWKWTFEAFFNRSVVFQSSAVSCYD